MTDYYISPTGLDTNNGLSPFTPWKGLNISVQKLYAGDTLSLMDGTWSEKISFPRSGNIGSPITLKKYSGIPTILHTSPSSNIIPIFGLSNITIDGLTIKNTLSINDNDAINVNNASSNINILNCKIYNTISGVYYSGISFDDGCYNCLVDNCEVYGDMWNSIQVMGLSTGVGAKRDSHNIIIQNTKVYNNSSHNGIDLRGNCYNVTVQNCEVYNISTPCLYTHQGLPHDNTIKNNVFHDSLDGIHADAGMSNSLFEGNYVYNCRDSNGSLVVRTGSNNTYRYNNICGLVGLSDSNPTIFCNNFTSLNTTPTCSGSRINSVSTIGTGNVTIYLDGVGLDTASSVQIYSKTVCSSIATGVITTKTPTQIIAQVNLVDGIYRVMTQDSSGRLSNGKDITISSTGCPTPQCSINIT